MLFWKINGKLENDDLCRQIKIISNWNDIFCYIILDRLLNRLRIFLEDRKNSWPLSPLQKFIFFWKFLLWIKMENKWTFFWKSRKISILSFFINSENGHKKWIFPQTLKTLVTLNKRQYFHFCHAFRKIQFIKFQLIFSWKFAKSKLEN